MLRKLIDEYNDILFKCWLPDEERHNLTDAIRTRLDNIKALIRLELKGEA